MGLISKVFIISLNTMSLFFSSLMFAISFHICLNTRHMRGRSEFDSWLYIFYSRRGPSSVDGGDNFGKVSNSTDSEMKRGTALRVLISIRRWVRAARPQPTSKLINCYSRPWLQNLSFKS
jgi:hypothetical protein